MKREGVTGMTKRMLIAFFGGLILPTTLVLTARATQLHIPANAKVKEGSNNKPEKVTLSGPASGPAAGPTSGPTSGPNANKREIYPKQTFVDLTHSTKNFPLKVRLVEVHPSAQNKVYSSKNVKDVSKYIPIIGDVKDGKLIYHGASSKLVAYLIENPTDKPYYFFAAPHSIDPVQEALGVKFRCLCLGEIFRIRPRHTFVRVMDLQILPQNRTNYLRLHHEIVGLSEFEVPPAEGE